MEPVTFAIITLALASCAVGWIGHWAYLEAKEFKMFKKKHPINKYPKAFITK